MGLFNKNKKDNKMVLEAPGWNAIIEECLRRYPTQKEPKHYGTVHPWRFGGPDPLDGIDVYFLNEKWVNFGPFYN